MIERAFESRDFKVLLKRGEEGIGLGFIIDEGKVKPVGVRQCLRVHLAAAADVDLGWFMRYRFFKRFIQ